MTLEDWHQTQEADPVLTLVIIRLTDGVLGKSQSQTTDPPKSVSIGRSAIVCCSKRVSYTDEPGPESQRRPSFSWFCQLHKGRLLSEDAMMRLVIWAWSTCLTSCVIGSSGLAWLPRQRAPREVLPMSAFKARQPKAPLKNIMATHPLELVHLDYLCLEPGKGLDENVLVVTDHFTMYTQVYVTRTQTTQMTAKTLWDKFIVHCGLPEKILMDRGQNVESQLLADLCELMGLWKIRTSPYHLQTNGWCERFNSTLINML